MSAKNRIQNFRTVVQAFFTALALYISIGHTLVEQGINLPGSANLHAVCPFGGVVNLYTFFAAGDYVSKLHQSNFVMIIALIFTLIFAGAFFCGWICPMGSVQEWIGIIGKNFFKTRYNKINKNLDFGLRFLKYIILGIVIYQTAVSGKLFFEGYDPYYVLFNFWSNEIAITGYIILAAVLLLSLYIERPFCRYACPLGAVNGLFNYFSLFTIKRKKDTCIDCKACDKICPTGIVISEGVAVNSPQCIRCMKCINVCPANKDDKNTLETRFIVSDITKKPSLRSVLVSIIALVIFAGTIIYTVLGGTFVTERIRTYETTNDIKGSSILKDVAENYSVTLDEIYHVFNIPKDKVPPETKIKDIGDLIGEEEFMEPSVLRTIVDSLNKNETDISAAMGKSIEEINKLTGIEWQESTLKEILLKTLPGSIGALFSGKEIKPSVNQETMAATQEGIKVTPETTSSNTEEKNSGGSSVKGSTTLRDIKEMVKDFEAFKKEFKIPDDTSLDKTLKTLKDELGIEVSDMRTYIESNLK